MFRVTSIFTNRTGFAAAALALAAAWYSSTTLAAVDEHLRCLAQNIYHEARGEQEAGQLAVAAVTLNRVRSPYFPNTVCEVVWQPWQFSWTRAYPEFHRVDPRAWDEAWRIARLALQGRYPPGIHRATHFHAREVRPEWSMGIRPLSRIGRHLFYAL